MPELNAELHLHRDQLDTPGPFSVVVSTLAEPVRLAVPPGSSDGTRFRLPQAGGQLGDVWLPSGERVAVDVPAGCEDGWALKLPGRGNRVAEATGDLFVSLRVDSRVAAQRSAGPTPEGGRVARVVDLVCLAIGLGALTAGFWPIIGATEAVPYLELRFFIIGVLALSLVLVFNLRGPRLLIAMTGLVGAVVGLLGWLQSSWSF